MCKNERATVKRVSFVFALLMTLAFSAGAQMFRVSVTTPARLDRGFTLWVYDTDSLPHTFKPTGKKGPVVFTGKVEGIGIAYAELRHTKSAEPLPFFIENTEITINYNAENPAASPITGSRTNSILRYQIEQCGSADAECLMQFATDNPSSPIVPYIIDRYLLTATDAESATALYKSLSGNATKTYHYRRLGKRLKRLAAVAEGQPLPSLVYTDKAGRTASIDTMLSDSGYTLLIVGATYCRQCVDIKREVKSAFAQVRTVSVDVDNLKEGWDAPLMQQLEIDHIPFLLLVDPQHRIAARDIRVWQLGRLLEKERGL